MALLPESERVQFFHERFLPLEAKEKALRALTGSCAASRRGPGLRESVSCYDSGTKIESWNRGAQNKRPRLI